MSRNTLYLIVGILVAALIVVGYLLLREEQEPSLEIQMDESGVSVETN